MSKSIVPAKKGSKPLEVHVSSSKTVFLNYTGLNFICIVLELQTLEGISMDQSTDHLKESFTLEDYKYFLLS